MHIFFSGAGGAGIGPLAIIAKQFGYSVSGSNDKPTHYLHELEKAGIRSIEIGQTAEHLEHIHTQHPIDWYVYTSALTKENPTHPELEQAKRLGIKTTERGPFLSQLLKDSKLPLIAIAGTHGKTTTTAMVIWLCQKLNIPISYSVGATSSFCDMGHYEQQSRYFIYECDEYERNFLNFHPHISLISGIDWDHPDTYPTRESYYAAFTQFIEQSEHTIGWQADIQKLNSLDHAAHNITCLENNNDRLHQLKLLGTVNRQDAILAIEAIRRCGDYDLQVLIDSMNTFPGVSRRFEQLMPGLYTDYAHTVPKIRGAIGVVVESNKPVTVVYEGLHNTRQHFIKEEFPTLFEGAEEVIVVPSFLAREDPNLSLLSPIDIVGMIHSPRHKTAAALDDQLWQLIEKRIHDGHLVLALSAGSTGSLDEWLRKKLETKQ